MKRFVLCILAAVSGVGEYQVLFGNSSSYAATAGRENNVVTQIASDMLQENEGHPHGIPPEWRLYRGPSISDGNRASTSCSGGPCGAIDYWGTVYADERGTPSRNSRVNIRNCSVSWLNASTGLWTRQGPDLSPEGVEDFPEKFDGPTNPTNVRLEPDRTISVLPGVGKTSHFYGPYPRVPIEPSQFAGIVAVCEMRLILNNASGPDDRGIARFVANVGSDFYPSTKGKGIPNNPGIAGGKFKFVKKDWRSFAMTTLSEQQLMQAPPPVSLAGVAP